MRAQSSRGSVFGLVLLLMAATSWAEDLSLADEVVVPQAELLRFLVDTSTFTLIDARTPGEFQTAHVNGAINLPHDQLADFAKLLPADRDANLVTYCRTGARAALLKAELSQLGYRNVRVLRGEQLFWGDGLAVFNCAATAALEADGPAFTKTKGN